jgi:hypothetical protein
MMFTGRNAAKSPQAETVIRTRRRIRASLLAITAAMPLMNLLGLIFIDPLATLMIEDSVLRRIDVVSAHPVVRLSNQVLPMVILAGVFIIYLIPLFRRLWNPVIDEVHGIVENIPHKTVRRLLRLPVMAAFLTSSGWLLAAPLIPIVAPAFGISTGPDFQFQYFAHAFILFGFTFVLSYYNQEVIVRNIMVPLCLRENAALEAGPGFSLSIGVRLVVFAVAGFLLPSVILGTSLSIINNGGENILGRNMTVILLQGLPVIAVLIGTITWLKIQTIQTPVRRWWYPMTRWSMP